MDLGLLVLRAVVGLLFAGHGAQKLFGVFGGGGLEGTAGMFDNIGLRPGSVHARAAGSAEFMGGLLLAVGLFTPFAAAAVIAIMTVAVVTVHAPNGIWNTNRATNTTWCWSPPPSPSPRSAPAGGRSTTPSAST